MRHYQAGTRGSALALWQTRHVAQLLAAQGVQSAERIITTRGDVDLSARLVGKLEKGLFTEELEEALRRGEVDWAVHSLKDLPTRMPPGLTLGSVLERAPAADLLLLRPEAVDAAPDARLPVRPGARVGTCSLRREAMLRHHAPRAVPVPLRGNVPTRVEKLREGLYDGIVLAEAGITRLGLDLSGLAVFRLSPAHWTCAPGQGAVAVQCREDDAEVLALLARIHHAETAAAVELERAFLRELEGGCTTPFGCHVSAGTVSLGLAVSGGWARREVPLPSQPTAAWMQAELSLLSRQSPEEMPHVPLAVRL